MEENYDVVRLHAGTKSSGQPVFEEVLIKRAAGGEVEVVRSPGLVLGIAAGDRIRPSGDQSGQFEIVSRGGNLCLQVFFSKPDPEAERWLTPRIQALGGTLDGRTDKSLVYTVSVDVGFPAVQEIFDQFSETFAGTEWYYGNVYDPADGVTPLNWWTKSQ